MTITRKRMIACEECGEEFEIETYDVIDANESPELRDKIIRNKLFIFKCPHCGKRIDGMYSFFYVDEKHNFKIQFNHKAKLFEYKIPEDSKYIEVGCCDSRDIVSKITCLENGIDYITEKLLEQVIQDIFEDDEEVKDEKRDLVFLFKNEETNELGYLYLFETKEKQVDFDVLAFSQEMYELVEEKSKHLRTDKFNCYLFDKEAAGKFLLQEEIDDSISELAILDTFQGEPIVIKVPDFNQDKFNEGDIVIAYDEENLIKGKIKKLIKINEKYSPFDEDSLPALLYKEQNVILETQEDSNYDLQNPELIQMFKVDKKWNEEKVLNSNVIMCLEHTMRLKDLKVQTKIDTTYKEGKRYVNVYLEAKDVKNSSLTKYVYKFDDVINFVLSDPYNYDGICVISNNITQILNHASLYRYKKYRIMCIRENMKELLFNLKEHEIEYVGKESYDVISYIYFEEASIPCAAKNFNVTEKEISNLLNEGYTRMEQVVACNY